MSWPSLAGSDNTIYDPDVQLIGRGSEKNAQLGLCDPEICEALRKCIFQKVFALIKGRPRIVDAENAGNSNRVRGMSRPVLSRRKENMFLAGSNRPLSELEDLELRRHRLNELITLDLVAPSLSEQIKKAISQLDRQISAIKQEYQQVRIAA